MWRKPISSPCWLASSSHIQDSNFCRFSTLWPRHAAVVVRILPSVASHLDLACCLLILFLA